MLKQSDLGGWGGRGRGESFLVEYLGGFLGEVAMKV